MGSVAICIVIALVLLDLLYHIVAVKVAIPIFESQPPFGAELFSPVPEAEQFDFPTTHNLWLKGCLLRGDRSSPRGLVLFCPELGSSRWSASAYCEGLLDAGFDVLAFDFRNQGDSECMPNYDPLHWLTEFEVADVMSAIAYIKSRPDLNRLPLATFGISRGGGAAIIAGARSPHVSCVISDGAFSTTAMLLHYVGRWGRLYIPEWLLRMLPRWHVAITLVLVQWRSQLRKGCIYAQLERALTQLGRKPICMVSGERDTYVIPEITRKLHSLTRQSAPQPWIVPNAKHNMARQVNSEKYDRHLLDFLAQLDSETPRQRLPLARAMNAR